MALTIDDGTFEVGNSFVTFATADNFAEARGYTDWVDGDEEAKEAALIRTFDFLSVQNWKSDTFDSGIPTKISNAQCIGAIKEFDTTGALQPDLATGIKSEEIDDVLSIEYFENGGGGGTIYSAVENMISPYINRIGVKTRIVRGGGSR